MAEGDADREPPDREPPDREPPEPPDREPPEPPDKNPPEKDIADKIVDRIVGPEADKIRERNRELENLPPLP